MATLLTLLARSRYAHLEVRIEVEAVGYVATIGVWYKRKLIACFGVQRRKSLEELQRAVSEKLTFQWHLTETRRRVIEETLGKSAQPHPGAPAGATVFC